MLDVQKNLTWKTSTFSKVSFKSHNFVQKVGKSLWLSGWERLQNREVHGLQSFCEGADRKKVRIKTIQVSPSTAVNLNRCVGEHTCMCSTADGGLCAAAWLTPAGGCPSACRWLQPAKVCQRQELPDNFLLLKTQKHDRHSWWDPTTKAVYSSKHRKVCGSAIYRSFWMTTVYCAKTEQSINVDTSWREKKYKK